MLKRLFAILLLVVATGTIPAASQSRYAWKDTYVTTSMNPVNNPRANDGIEVYTRPGALIVRCPERTNVVVMTILGQTISKATINAGTHELRIGTHGIYILKLGDTTVRPITTITLQIALSPHRAALPQVSHRDTPQQLHRAACILPGD